MKRLIAVAAAVSALALGACDKPTTVVEPTAPVVVVPGPAGPQGATGAPAERGATGATGAEGVQGDKGDKGKQGDGTIVVVPAPDQQR